MAYNNGRMAHYSFPRSAGAIGIPSGTTRVSSGLNAAQIVPLLIWLCFPITLALAITRQSLWIDEGFTVWFASHSSFHAFFAALIGSRGAAGDPQFIFYLLHMWGWIKLFGSSELSLRAANIPFAIIFVCAMGWASRHLFWNRNLWALFCLSPFFWFYLNEARPYVALLAFSSVASVALLAYLIDPARCCKAAPWFCLIALFLAWGAHILAMFLFPALLVLIVTTLVGNSTLKSDFLRHWSRPILYCFPAFMALGIFYVWTSANGVNKVDANPGFANLAFALYEFAGFAGLGPPRNDIRQSLNLTVFLPYWPLLLVGAMTLVAAVSSAFRVTPSRIVRNLILSVAVGIAVALAISTFQHFQLLGRHLAVFFPLILMVVMLTPKNSADSPIPARNAAVSFIALALVWGISDFRLVFLSKYEKDSYREACSIALARARQDGAVILWAADPLTAQYYGITVARKNSAWDFGSNRGVHGSFLDQAIEASGWSADQRNAYFAKSSVPTILVLSKPDTFDPKGAWTALIREQEPAQIARLNALSIFEWQSQGAASCSDCSNQLPAPADLSVESSSPNNSGLD